MRQIPARFNGYQEYPGRAPFALWTIYVDMPGHPRYSTVSERTLREAGFEPFDIMQVSHG